VRQKLFIFLTLIFLTIVLVGLNAASFVQKEKVPDSEAEPNRSTYNFGATGTRAFYDLLAETGRRPARWLEPPSALLSGGKIKPSTFVVVGETRREFTDKEIEQLLRWVSFGGRLVIIDREPPEELVKTTANWLVSTSNSKENIFFEADPSNPNQMTEKTSAAKPTQPTVFTDKVNAVQSSRFASSANFEHISDGNKPILKYTKQANGIGEGTSENPPPPKPTNSEDSSGEEGSEDVETAALDAPVVHLANNDKNLLVDFPFGSGQIVFLTDPYIVSNGGIGLVDNAQLATNIAASREGIVAFDEYHQGYGEGSNQILTYFAGTPVVAMFLQLLVLAGLIFFTQSRRFARPVPETEPNRFAKLEYVSAMAELQRRAKAFDLAIENIYNEFRRRASRLVGVDNFTTSYKNLAQLIAERGKLNAAEIENLMFKCEDIIRGEPTNKREVLQITGRLREIEEKLGLKRQRAARR
jgi:Na+-transporting methylmalonyl-CoA/oxaloacetate decarboxylase gamma subunit